jgi:hypothetical protein
MNDPKVPGVSRNIYGRGHILNASSVTSKRAICMLKQGSSGPDLVGTDLIWSGLFAPGLIDQQPCWVAGLSSVAPQLLPSYTIEGKAIWKLFEHGNRG